MKPADLRIGVFGGDHLALFGQADLAVHRAGRLRQNGVVARAAAASDRAPAPVKQPHRNIGLAGEELRQRRRGAVKLPNARENAAVLVAVGIAQHDVLLGARVGDELGDSRQRIEVSHDRRGVAQILDGLEQRHDDQIRRDDAGVARIERAVHHAAFLLQQQHFQKIADGLGVADDVMADRLVAVGLAHRGGLGEDRQFVLDG